MYSWHVPYNEYTFQHFLNTVVDKGFMEGFTVKLVVCNTSEASYVKLFFLTVTGNFVLEQHLAPLIPHFYKFMQLEVVCV